MRMEPSEDCWASRTAKQDLNCMTPLEELHGRRKQGSVTRDIDSWPEISLTLSRFGFLQHPILHRDHDPIALFGASYPNSGDQKDFYFLAICLMYTTREFMTSGENFQPKAGHLVSSLADNSRELGIRLPLHFVGPEIFGFQGLTGLLTAAVWPMARRTIGLEELGGITLGSCPSREHQDSETDKERCWCESHKHLLHIVSSIQLDRTAANLCWAASLSQRGSYVLYPC